MWYARKGIDVGAPVESAEADGEFEGAPSVPSSYD